MTHKRFNQQRFSTTERCAQDHRRRPGSHIVQHSQAVLRQSLDNRLAFTVTQGGWETRLLKVLTTGLA